MKDQKMNKRPISNGRILTPFLVGRTCRSATNGLGAQFSLPRCSTRNCNPTNYETNPNKKFKNNSCKTCYEYSMSQNEPKTNPKSGSFSRSVQNAKPRFGPRFGP